MNSKFKHIDLKLIKPDFGSNLTKLILDLDYLRKRKIEGTTCPVLFYQLKKIFHLMESIGSLRIEGNRTTLIEYVEQKIDNKNDKKNENVLEIENNEKALSFIDENIDRIKIDRAFLSHIHIILTKNLSIPSIGEGSRNPGDYRKINVVIHGSSHCPPESVLVNSYMDELIKFINNDDPPQYDLLKVAIAHHRFSWIHPFDNGNGRVVRLLTYAMLIKSGFKVDVGQRILNPVAIFCNDREKYYKYLSTADSGNDEDILEWCEYVLSGLKNEINKIDNLLDYKFLREKIFLPSLNLARDKRYINDNEFKILQLAVNKQIISAGDIKTLFPDKIPAEISRMIRRLKEKGILQSDSNNVRKYIFSFENNYLLRCIIEMLRNQNFISDMIYFG